ncbi:MAG: sigma-54-dependent Fis family transcriptional regulator [Pirellulaceae bacterium]|nr:MAG: sigma-54-dependent Fis family transcriptional regulator [Pirellulaceae bacterium]
MRAVLRVIRGTAVPPEHPLDSSLPIRIGRGSGCQIRLADPLSSRTHAIVLREDNQWVVADAESRNGTLVNNRKVSHHRLSPGDHIRIGSTELIFDTIDDAADEAAEVSQTLVMEAPMSVDASGVNSISLLATRQRSQDMLDLYQLSIGLMRCSQPDDVVRRGLELLQHRTQANAVGFLWLDEHGQLRPQVVLPEDTPERFVLSRHTSERVLKEHHAVRLQSPGAQTDSDVDMICVPLVNEHAATGAIVLTRDTGQFESLHFDLAISVGNLLAVALESSRSQARLSAEHQRLQERLGDFPELIGDSPEMLKLKDRITRVARAGGCVLVRGESGVGKELVARAIHRNSPRADRPMLSVNCAAIPADLIDSQLFGHRKGAFTGADQDHRGWFQQAHTGTLFLDEVGELTLDAQAKLLRVLEGHPFQPVGSTKEVKVDVRVIAATNRDLRESVRERRFREDLYYRLSVFELYVPPLRERGEDIERLIVHFLNHFRKQHGRPSLELSAEAKRVLLAYNWPGNVRQLRNVIDSAVVLAVGDAIQPEDLSLRDIHNGTLDSLRIDEWEKRLIVEAIRRTGDNVNEAAKLLGISRATLYRKLDQYGIDRKAIGSADS